MTWTSASSSLMIGGAIVYTIVLVFSNTNGNYDFYAMIPSMSFMCISSVLVRRFKWFSGSKFNDDSFVFPVKLMI